jgi:CRP/FNR family transcriptional regulator, cyclic AMP receptor protein
VISPELLRRNPFFAGLTTDHLRGIAMIANEVTFPANTYIFKEGEEARYLYVLVAGEVELLHSVGYGDAVTDTYVGSITQGEIFGISTMIEPFLLTASAKSEDPVETIQIEAAGLRAMCEVDHGLGYLLMQHLAHTLIGRLHEARIQLPHSKPT